MINFKFIFTVPVLCKTIRDLKDSNSNYLKSVCTMYLKYNQISARDTCKANGMQLYKFVVPDDEVALLAYADSQWPQARLWVDGGNTTHGTMLSNFNRTYFEKVSTPIFTNFEYFYCEYKSKKELC
jgi:hypothetical protein